MRRINPCIIMICLVVFIADAAFCQSHEWKQIRNDKGINVYSRNSPESSIKEIRITAEVKATMESTIEVLSDVMEYPSWVYKCDSAMLLQTISENEFIYYTTLNFPFPMTDRDLTIHSSHYVDSLGVYNSHSVAKTAYADRNDTYVHIVNFESSWVIAPSKNDTLLIDYMAHSDPGGDIPTWLVNLAIDQGPFLTMKKFIEKVESLTID